MTLVDESGIVPMQMEKMGIHFSVYTDPVPKGRPRLSRMRVYTPKKTIDFESYVKNTARIAMRNASLFSGPIEVSLVFLLKKPKRVQRVYPSVRPDIDNYIKSVCDAFNGVVWEDDSQVVRLSAAKVYTPHDQKPCIKVSVWKIT